MALFVLGGADWFGTSRRDMPRCAESRQRKRGAPAASLAAEILRYVTLCYVTLRHVTPRMHCGGSLVVGA